MAFKMKYRGFPKETKYLDDKENPKAKPSGHEPPVKRSDLDAAGKALWDKQRGISPETNFDSRIETEAEVKKANALEDANQGYTPRYIHRVPKAHGNK